MSKVKCDVCGIDLSKSGLAHHKKTKKHLIEEAKKYGKYDFATGKIMQNGGAQPNQSILGNLLENNTVDIPEILIAHPKVFKYERLDPNLSRKDKNMKTLILLDDFMKDISPKPYFVEQLRAHVETFDKIV